MNFVDVCFKSNVVGTIDTYNCETTLYGINEEYDEIAILTLIYGKNGLISEIYNKNINNKELQNINDILLNRGFRIQNR